MAVNATHRAYRKHVPQWTRCRDTYAGSDAIKGKTTVYLPLLEGHANISSLGYIGYLARALFYPAVGRTVAGLTGLVFAKMPTVKGVPVSEQTAFNDVTLTGTSLGAYGLNLCRETLITGRVGTLIDVAETPSPENAPYWVTYTAEQIVNWRTSRINGKMQLTMLVLSEEIETPGEDEFEPKVDTQYRVLKLTPTATGHVYSVRLYRPNPNEKGKFLPDAARIPIRRNQPLNFIPFTMLSAEGIDFLDVAPPPLLALADVNLSHYRTSADHEHGAHFTALPTPYVTGHKMDPGEQLTIGSGQAWVLDKDATAGMVEFSGAGLKSLADLKEDKRQLMATLGARMLETDKNTAEAAQTVRLRHSGESSAMSVLADAVGQSLTQSLRWHLWWAGFEETITNQVSVTMNPDVMEDLTADDVRALMELWQKNGISKRTLHYNLAWGEWTRPGVTFEQEEQEIKEENKPPPAPVPVPPVPEPEPVAT